ncbi:CDP-glycerol glycerophosphotransferase family protein [Micromonospora sp. 4G57]|uniref:CDP-glycerol glycerophosphotransferase family protein n=1 Tax=Micromonospora sicca TaxID=2202420 RepID=A0ABU5JKE6_9ACTN|nr:MULTISPECIES: CDP-glycerol glycerophosphotransferase family protein [unclassified Micromonospora]MDZ5447484.1 CDP-glycerol glycerophosphotransferase family protein [Micromonospora sp. 4G57]MDZ5493105.1 CDP-glycerol glycerophosphotransferase family protein [Micromonospora sp. 4G53]
MRGDLVRKLLARVLTTGLAVLAFLVVALTGATGWGLAIAVAALAAAAVERRIRPGADGVAESVLVAAGILVGYARRLDGGFHAALAATALVLLGLVLLAAPLRAAGALEIRAANLPVRTWTPRVTERLGDALLVLLGLVAVAAAATLPAWVPLVAVLLVAAGCAAVGLDLARRRFRPPAGGGPVGRALRRHQPEFLLYFSAPPGSEYQVTMWLPYLERIGRPFLVLLREPEFLPAIAAATSAPVVFCPTLKTMDEALVPSLRAAFYVNHGAKNSHCIRFSQLTHVQLHHGDSDKAPSANPVSAIFDRIFVAGPAAIDRYARAGVEIPAEKFVVVGRPQVEAIEVRREPARRLAAPTVLYTPTWTGHHADADYCSLPVAETVIRRLLDRGATVILRAHPYTGQNPTSARQLARLTELLAADQARTGRAHLWGATTRELTLTECVNRSDALVSDVSGVISDYLYSGKPYAVTDMGVDGEHFVERFPLAGSGYVLRRDMSNVDDVLAELLDTDPKAADRWATRSRYLGDFPADSYAEAFVDAARRQLEPDWNPPAPRAADAVTQHGSPLSPTP